MKTPPPRRPFPKCRDCRWLLVRSHPDGFRWCVLKEKTIQHARLRRRACKGFEAADPSHP